MTLSLTERDVIEEVAERYRKAGYEVEVEPVPIVQDGQTLRPDLVATRPGELRLVEVKSGRTRFGEAQRVALDAWMKSHEGAHLDIVVVGVKTVPFTLPVAEELTERLKRSERLLQEGEADAALLLAWALFEAAARRRLYLETGESAASVGIGMLHAAARQGLVDPDRADRLRTLFAARNALAHGAFPLRVDVDGIRELLATIGELLTEPVAPSDHRDE